MIYDSSDIVAEAEGPGKELRQGRITRHLTWGSVRGGSTGLGCSCVEEGGRRPGGREKSGPSPVVMAINLLLSSNETNLNYLRDFFYRN